MEYAFDFDTLSRLSDQNPQAYFAERARLIEEFIASAPESRRDDLRRFQAEIDAVRASAGTPGKAVETLMGMMSDHLHVLLGQTQNLAEQARALRAQMAPARAA